MASAWGRAAKRGDRCYLGSAERGLRLQSSRYRRNDRGRRGLLLWIGQRRGHVGERSHRRGPVRSAGGVGLLARFGTCDALVGEPRGDELDLLGVNQFALREDRGLLHDVAQLAHVAGPLMAEEPLERLVRETPRRRSVALAEEPEEALGNGNDVLGPIAQRRDRDGKDVEPVIEVFAKLIRFDQIQKVAVGGGDDANIGVALLVRADPGEPVRLENTQ